MGMGMLGALGGLGDAGVQIGNQMMQGAIRSDLQKEHMEILRQERERVESVAEAKRKQIGEIIRNASSGSMQGEGPPTEDGVMPKRPMSERERVSAARDALYGAGQTEQGRLMDDRLYRIDMMERDSRRNDIQDQRYENDAKFRERQADLADQREKRMADIQAKQLNLQGAAASRAERSLKLQEGDAEAKRKATGYVAGYKVSKARGLLDAADTYREYALGLGVDPEAMKHGTTKIMKDDNGRDIAVHEDASGNLTRIEPTELPQYGGKKASSGRTGFDPSTGEVFKNGQMVGKAGSVEDARKLLSGLK